MKKLLRFFLPLLAAALLLSICASAEYDSGYSDGMAGDGAGIYAHGIDLSAWQGHEVDFEKIAQQGYAFVILRAGYSMTEDETFEENYARAKAAGLDVGAYLYSYAQTPEGARAEAAACKKWLRGKRLEYPFYFDIEDPQKHEPMSSESRTALASAFLTSMAEDGWLCGFYSSMSWLENKLDTALLGASYECWMAMYLPGGSCETYERYHGRFGMWQYTASGTVEGVPGTVDLNVAFKDYPSICREYGFSGYPRSGEPISLSGVNVPELIAAGESFPITGRVTSAENKLTNVTVGIYSADGEMVTGRSVGPKALKCDLSELASGVKMQTLAKGCYEFRVTATNTSTTRVLLRQTLRVADGGVWLESCTPPKDLHVGEAFRPTGLLTSDKTITDVELTVRDQKGTAVCSARAEPNQKTYDLSGEALDVTRLPRGSYIYCVTANAGRGRTELLRADFKVWANDDPVELTGLALREDRFYGESFGLEGVVTSKASALDRVSVTLSGLDGTVAASSETTDGRQQVLLSRLCRALDEQALPVGSYVLTVTAQNAGGPVELLRRDVSVSGDALSLCGLTPPVLIECGESAVIEGVVASDATRLRYVALTVLNAEGRPVRQCAAAPDSYVYDLTAMGKELLLSTLEAGEYRLLAAAENAHNYSTLCDTPLTVTRSRDSVHWSGDRFSLDGRAYAAGEAISLWGLLRSDVSELQSVTAEIVNTDGERFCTAALQTSGTEFSVDALNQGLRTAALPTGAYTLTIWAENASGTYRVAFERFFVTECQHRSVRSGLRYEPDCVSAGAICDSRCLFCGQSVRAGQLLPRTEHTMQDGACTRCGRTAYRSVGAELSDGLPEDNGRYVIAACENDKWFALGPDGTAVPIVPPENGTYIMVTADLLWTADVKQDTVAFCSAAGEWLHLDENGPRIAPGLTHTQLSARLTSDGIVLSLDGMGRSLAFKEGNFTKLNDKTSLFLFKLAVSTK